jgi:hypothetical protein
MLDENKRKKIIALLANGSSRRVAAKYVGCSPSTITRTAAADPDFAEQLNTAEHSAEIDAIRSIRAASRKDCYWRAAAWILERKNPEDFALRPPTLFSGEEVFQMMSLIIDILHQDIPEENCQRAMETIEHIIETQCQLQTTPTFPNHPRPLALTPNSSPAEHPSFEPNQVPILPSDTTPDPNTTSAPLQ